MSEGKKKKKSQAENEWELDSDTFTVITDEFEKDSERSVAVLVGAVLSESLDGLLRSHFVDNRKVSRKLLEGGIGPIGTFSVRIDVSYILGLISRQRHRDLHIIRKIRNDFAHDVMGCSFEDTKIKDQINELKKSFQSSEVYKAFRYRLGDKSSRWEFQFISSMCMLELRRETKLIKRLNEKELEWTHTVRLRERS